LNSFLALTGHSPSAHDFLAEKSLCTPQTAFFRKLLGKTKLFAEICAVQVKGLKSLQGEGGDR
jgi:hypothetical protein